MKTEIWCGHEIRFIVKDGEWWAVLRDVCDAVGLKPKHVKERLEDEVVSTDLLNDRNGRPHNTLIVNEFGIYDTVFQSRKKEAVEFRHWVYSLLKELRQSLNMEGFEIFRLLDKEHQKDAMRLLKNNLKNPVRVNFIKANTIANKAVSIKFGYNKMIKKSDMSSMMLVDREPILNDIVNLMSLNDKYGLDISISETIYSSLNNEKEDIR